MDSEDLKQFDLLNDAVRFHADKIKNIEHEMLGRWFRNLFRKIDFDIHSQDIESSLHSLKNIDAQIWGEIQLSRIGKTLREFLFSLQYFGRQLHRVAVELDRKAIGGQYSLSNYNDDLEMLSEASELVETARQMHNSVLHDFFSNRPQS